MPDDSKVCSLLLVLVLNIVFSCLAVAEDLLIPQAIWTVAEPSEAGLDGELLIAARDYALTGEGAGMIVRSGKVVMRWGDQRQKFDLKSSTKSIGLTALGLALADKKLSLDDLASHDHPSFGVPPESNRATGWIERITIRQLATQTAGFDKPGGYEPLLFEPGSKWHYSDGGPNWLAECITLIYDRDLEQLLFERVFTPLGIENNDLHWRKNAYRDPMIGGHKRIEFGSGVHANVDAMARIGLLYLREGKWGSQQLLPADFCQAVGRTPDSIRGLPEQLPDYDDASRHYGLLWWNNNDGSLPAVPRDAFWSWGLYDSLIVVIPSLDMVAVRAGKSWKRDGRASHYSVLAPFIGAVARSAAPGPPYPTSDLVEEVSWAPVPEIVRLAEGSDNWPLAWAADDSLLTAYGDGWGFEPKTKQKLSLGIARVTGPPSDPVGENIRTDSGERLGQGANGVKASGMLMIDGRLYMLVRNAENSQLAWSADAGQSWTWADWKFEQSFGCPTFLAFGKDYSGSRDEYVYIYSPDNESAYEPADGVVLARIARHNLSDQDSYEFFAGMVDGQPTWSKVLERRRAVFKNPGRCYRMSVNYHPALKRYLLCQIMPESWHANGQRFEGGFGIYEAPEPWGPWSTVYFTNHWDVGPGESASLPTKWSSEDGRTWHLVFSGNDCFSVRRATVKLSQP